MRRNTSTKEKVLNVLKKDGKCTMKELMEYFTISEVAVRKHIHELEQQKLIKSEPVKQEIGRPYYRYKLTGEGHATFPNQNETLPLELLQDLENLHGKQMVEDVLKKRAKREEELFKRKFVSKNFDEKIEKLISIQEKKGYMFDLEKSKDGSYEIINHNCPIINIASTYKQICQNEKGMIDNLFSTSDVKFRSCITSGDHSCRWVITKPNDNSGYKIEE